MEYRVTLSTDVGDQPALFKDVAYLYSAVSGGSYSFSITGADNAVDDITGLKEDATVVGEAPARYGSAVVDADQLSYTINGLESGIEYYLRVSAVNAYGAGPVLRAATRSASTERGAPSRRRCTPWGSAARAAAPPRTPPPSWRCASRAPLASPAASWVRCRGMCAPCPSSERLWRQTFSARAQTTCHSP